MGRVVDATAPAVLGIGEGIDAIAALTADLPRSEAEAADTGAALAPARVTARAVIATATAVLGVGLQVDAGAAAAGTAPLPSRATPAGSPTSPGFGRRCEGDPGAASNPAEYGPSAAATCERLSEGIEADRVHTGSPVVMRERDASSLLGRISAQLGPSRIRSGASP
jgi:hypothetical protein